MKPFSFTCPIGHRFSIYAAGLSRDERETIEARGCPYCSMANEQDHDLDECQERVKQASKVII